jgi:ATP-dependent helicase HrpA/adenine-specific DNA-methyltransferase
MTIQRATPQLARRLRQAPTWAEKQMWKLLRNRRFVGFKFRRQHPIGPYVADFYCVAAKLAIELDGDVHGTPKQREHDAAKERYLSGLGIRTLHFWNIDLLEHEDDVLTVILRELENRAGSNPHPDPLPSERERGQTVRSLLHRSGGKGQDEGVGVKATINKLGDHNG